MLMHLTAGHVTLLPGKFQPPELTPQSDLGRRADSRCHRSEQQQQAQFELKTKVIWQKAELLSFVFGRWQHKTDSLVAICN